MDSTIPRLINDLDETQKRRLTGFGAWQFSASWEYEERSRQIKPQLRADLEQLYQAVEPCGILITIDEVSADAGCAIWRSLLCRFRMRCHRGRRSWWSLRASRWTQRIREVLGLGEGRVSLPYLDQYIRAQNRTEETEGSAESDGWDDVPPPPVDSAM